MLLARPVHSTQFSSNITLLACATFFLQPLSGQNLTTQGQVFFYCFLWKACLATMVYSEENKRKKTWYVAIQVIFIYISLLGGFLSLGPDHGKLDRTVTSPLLGGDQWRCMRFWYRIGLGHDTQLKVFLRRSNITKQLWRTSHRTSSWSFVQLSINTNATARVISLMHDYVSCSGKIQASFTRNSSQLLARTYCLHDFIFDALEIRSW